jgi:PKD repeat protein
MRPRDYFSTVFAVLSSTVALTAFLGMMPLSVLAQSEVALEKMQARAVNRPLHSLREAADRARFNAYKPGPPRQVANYRRDGRPLAENQTSLPDAILQESAGTLAATTMGAGFPGTSNDANGDLFGFLIAPPDTDGQVGPDHFVQMINLVTTIFNKDGTVAIPPFGSNAFWDGVGGNCEPNNQGDPIVLYDEQVDRWVVSQFAFPDNQSSFSQCVAVSQTGDPTGGFNRYEFNFDGIGFPDYPKHGIVTDSITLMANIFVPRGRSFYWGGTFLGVIDKNAMYAGQPASLLGSNIGTGEFGFVAGDLDGLGTAPALFATAMSNTGKFDIWQADVNWNTEAFSLNRVAAIEITPFDQDLCSASREACIPQPNGGPALEALSDRLMHRLQLRDFGNYRTMVTAHAVDVGGGRAGVRWYEFREQGGPWFLYQEGTFAPNDGENRWVPSAAMNTAGDIGVGYLLASSNTFVSTAASGQSAAASGTGVFDADELVCAPGSGVQLNVNRAGDYSSTSVDPIDDTFWHTNEVFVDTASYQWATYVCEFAVSDGGPVNAAPTASFTASCMDLTCTFTDTSNDDGPLTWSWDFGETGGMSTDQNPVYTYAAPGTYTVTLTVDDGEFTDEATGNVSPEEPANIAPTASFTFNCTDKTCDFDGSDSSDSDGTITAYAWTFAGTGTASGETASHTFGDYGDYTVNLTVTDDDNATGTDTQTIILTDPGAGPTLVTNAVPVRNKWNATVEWSDGSLLSGSWSTGDQCEEQAICELSGINRRVTSVTFTESTTNETVEIFKP